MMAKIPQVNGITHAVIPAAGLGTRFLPATKAIPKEMLPVVDKPAIQYVVEEAISAGFTDLLLITGHNKEALLNHFKPAKELEEILKLRDNDRGLAALEHLNSFPTINTLRQEAPRGLGDAILTAADYIGNSSFAVLLGDDLIDKSDLLWKKMSEVHARHGGCVLALMEVPDSDLSKYGIAEVVVGRSAGALRITNLIEKPSKVQAPSNYAIIGRYILAPEIFAILAKTATGHGNEIQLTDALAAMAVNENIGGPVHAVLSDVRRFDTGDRLSYLKTVVEFASVRQEFGKEFNGWLKNFVRGLDD